MHFAFLFHFYIIFFYFSILCLFLCLFSRQIKENRLPKPGNVAFVAAMTASPNHWIENVRSFHDAKKERKKIYRRENVNGKLVKSILIGNISFKNKMRHLKPFRKLFQHFISLSFTLYLVHYFFLFFGLVCHFIRKKNTT